MEYNITNPDIHKYLTKENFEMVLDTFYEIEPDFDEEKALEMTILSNYFLAPFLTKKCIRTLVPAVLVNENGKCFELGLDPMMTEKQMKINDLLEFAKEWSLDELHKAIVKQFPAGCLVARSFFGLSKKACMSESSKFTKLKRKDETRGSSM